MCGVFKIVCYTVKKIEATSKAENVFTVLFPVVQLWLGLVGKEFAKTVKQYPCAGVLLLYFS